MLRKVYHVNEGLQVQYQGKLYTLTPCKHAKTKVADIFLRALHVSGMEDLLLYLASSDEEKQYALHVLEIVSRMFREQTPEQLAGAGGPRAQTERDRDLQ